MFGWLNRKAYILIGLGTAGVFFIMGQIAGTQLVNFFRDFEQRANSAGISYGVTSLVTQPLFLLLNGEPIACIIAGVMWPVVILLIFMMFLIIIFAILGPAIGGVGSHISGN
jgi:hypothetical protein